LRKGEATRSRIVETASREAAMRGLMAVSLGDVAEAVGLSKSGIFKHFDSKEAMQLAIVEACLDKFTAKLLAPAQALAPGRSRIEQVFGAWLHWSEREWPDCGCPINAFTVELDDQPGPLRDLLHVRLKAFRKAMIGEFQALRDPPLSEPEAQAAYFQMKSFILGYGEARRMMGDADAERSATSAFEALLDRTCLNAA
jgi:AcrR family transcriptional regulator